MKDINISIPVRDMKDWGRVNELIDRIAPDYHSAGTGFGFRDFSWTVESNDAAGALVERVRSAVLEHLGAAVWQRVEVSLFNKEDDDEQTSS